MSINKEAESSRQIKMGALLAYLTIAFTMLSGLIYTPWMVNSIGQSNYGLYTLSTSIIGMFVLDFGLSTSVTRFLSKYNAMNDQPSINSLLGIICKLFFFLDTVIITILTIIYLIIGDIYQGLSPVELDKLKVIFIISAVYSVFALPFSTLNGILVSYEKFVLYKSCELFNRIFTVTAMVILLGLGNGLFSLVIVNVVSGSITIALKLAIVMRKTPVKINLSYKNKIMLKELLGFSLWSTLISISERFIFNIIPTILGALASAVSIANFGVASTLEGYVYTFSSALSDLFLPKVSRILTKEDSREDLLTLMIRVGRIQFLLLGLVIMGFFAIGKEFIILWMGNDYITSYYCTVFMIFPSLLILPQQIAQQGIAVVNKIKLQSYVYMVMAGINVILSFYLSGCLGELGAAVSICTAYLFRFVIMNILYFKELKINVFSFYKECYLKIGYAFLIIGVLINRLQTIITISGWLGFIVKVIMISFVYILINWILTLNTFEKNLFVSLIRKVTGNKRYKGINF